MEMNGIKKLAEYDAMAEVIKSVMKDELISIVNENHKSIDFLDNDKFEQMYGLNPYANDEDDDFDMVTELYVNDDNQLIVEAETSGENNFMHMTFSQCRLVYEAIVYDFMKNEE